MARMTDTIICISESEYRIAYKYKLDRFTRLIKIENGVDVVQFTNLKNRNAFRKKYHLINDVTIVTMVGDLSLRKGWQTYLLAAKKVVEKLPNVYFLVVGEGELQETIKNDIAVLGIDKNVVMTGYIEEIQEIYSCTDIVVNCSLYEGLPYVVLEAMSMELPVIVTNVLGNKDLVVHRKTGLLVSIGDIEGISNAILKLCMNKQLSQKIGRAGRQQVVNHFSMELSLSKLEKLYSIAVK